MNKSNCPIGVFDSGMGGLTVLKQLIQKLPHERFIYLGDTARVPYGTKSTQAIEFYAWQLTSILMQHSIKLLVVACNTASAIALSHLKQQFPNLPIIGVIEPGIQSALANTRNNAIAILGTEATIASKIYPFLLQKERKNIQFKDLACGLWVALAEEGSIDNELAKMAISQYLTPIIESSISYDCVLLGCTHFPVFIPLIQSVLGESVTVVDSAKVTAQVVVDTLLEQQIRRSEHHSERHFLVTDLTDRFIRIGERFLGQPIEAKHVQLIHTRKVL